MGAIEMDPVRLSGRISLGLVSLIAGGGAHASGFALLEHSASRMGTAYAGAGSAIDDVTLMFYNPAGLTRLTDTEIAIVASGVGISSQFNNSSSQPAYGQPLGNDGGDAGGWNFIPAAYAAMPINDRLVAAVAVNAPMGLALEFEAGWMGRYQALKSEIMTINVNPTIAFELTKNFSVAVGLNYQQVDAELTNAVNYSAVIAQAGAQAVGSGAISPGVYASTLAATQGLDGHAVVSGDDAAWGYNLGILFEPAEGTRIGLSYRSSIKYDIEGTVRFTPPTISNPVGAGLAALAAAPGAQLASGPGSVELRVPDTTLLSLSQQVAPKLELMADVALVGWSSVREIRVRRNTGETVSVTPEDWDDAWRFAIGGAYQLSPSLKLRAGVTHDQSQVPDRTRTPRLPDSERTVVAIGAQWKANDNMQFDVAYGHLFTPDASLNQDGGNAQANGVLRGEQESNIELLSAQFVYRF
jgi:long-chain fatty acid transport protein